MNPLLVEALGAIVRWALTFGAGVLVQHGIWSPEASSKYVAAAAAAILTLAWSLWQKYRMRAKLVTALTLPPGYSEHEVEQQVNRGMGASVTTKKSEAP